MLSSPWVGQVDLRLDENRLTSSPIPMGHDDAATIARHRRQASECTVNCQREGSIILYHLMTLYNSLIIRLIVGEKESRPRLKIVERLSAGSRMPSTSTSRNITYKQHLPALFPSLA